MSEPTTHAPLPKGKSKTEESQAKGQPFQGQSTDLVVPPDIAKDATVPASQYTEIAQQLNVKQARIEELTAKIAELEQQLKDQEKAFLIRLDQVSPEAIYSSTMVIQNASGFRKQVTVRSRPGEKWNEFRDREEFGILKAYFDEGWKPADSLYAPRATQSAPAGARAPAKGAPERAAKGAAKGAAVAPKPLPGRDKGKSDWDGHTECFDAVAMTVSVSESGEKRFKIKDAQKWTAFGVPIYEEALQEAGFDPNDFEPGTTYDMTGYRAYYTENASGNPYKVVRLTEEE